MADGNKSGIERLREFNYLPKDGCPPSEFRRIAKIKCIGTACCDCVNLCNEYITGIADQIEREHTDALNAKIELIFTLMMKIDDLSQHGGKQDSGREAAADWVAENGGLDTVSNRYHEYMDIAKMVLEELGIYRSNITYPDAKEAIKDELNERLMPRGMEWPPKDVYGEDLQIGDKSHFLRTEYDGDHEWDDFITAFRHDGIASEGDVWIVESEHGEAFSCDCSLVKRPEPDILGADGLLIKVGDIVFGEDGTAWEVKGLTEGEYQILAEKVLDASKRELRPEWLTHKHPDTQKLIDDDSTLPPGIYCENHGIEVNSNGGFDLASFIVPMITDLLRRQRELDSKMGGE